MTSSQIRQSFLDFFKSKGHTLVPSSSLMPDSPNLLFTNAGMNQFVPIFLGQRAPDVTKWAGAIPGSDTRAADTQKCIRAGGKHNDLEDVGLDTYHHTFFEMLGNWSFGDPSYFKKEAIEWAWELVVGKWKFPANRLYATVFCPYTDVNRWNDELANTVALAKDSMAGAHTEIIGTGNPAAEVEWSDKEAAFQWALLFLKAGRDPITHIIPGGKKDNLWMMGDTGPFGPCSELHVDLTPEERTLEIEKRGSTLVNKGDARCIEIWNLVFIQFNANPNGSFSRLPARHVDTGMGFERVTGIIQNTKNEQGESFKDFTRVISNYETDIFRPIFDKLEHLSGKKYRSTLPKAPPSGEKEPSGLRNEPAGSGSEPSGPVNGASGETPGTAGEAHQIAIDIAFRVIADHIRTLSFAIADGIQPGNTDRNYVLRRILRRAVRYGRTLGFHEPFFYKLVAVLADKMGHVFPELRAKQDHIEQVIQREEEAFNRTLDKGIELFVKRVESQTSMFTGIARFHDSGMISDFRGRLSRLPDSIEASGRYLSVMFNELHDLMYGFNLQKMRLVKHNDAGSFFQHILLKDPSIFAVMTKNELTVVGEIFPLYCDLGSASGDDVKDFRQEHDLDETSPEYAEDINQLNELKKRQAESFRRLQSDWPNRLLVFEKGIIETRLNHPEQINGDFAFKLYDEQGFPLDLTELMARERGLTVDVAGFNKLMDEQKARARAAQKKQVIELSQVETTTPTRFVGFDKLESAAQVLEVVGVKDKTAVILDASPLYAEMGGQVGDTGEMSGGGELWTIANTQKAGDAWLHFLADKDAPAAGTQVQLSVDRPRREAIQRHHTVTHLLHWALHEVVNKDATQKGSYVGPEKLTFDFSSAPLTPQQVADVERLVNERILENAAVSWTEVGYGDVKARPDIMQFFGDKYGDRVRVVQVGGKATALDGYSMELCGGTHTRATGEIGLFRIVGESAIAAGIRRIEAVSGLEAYKRASEELQLIKTVAGKVNSPVGELEKKIESLLAQQKDLEKQIKVMQQKQAAEIARGLAAKAHTFGTTLAIVENLGAADGDLLQSIADALKGQFKGVVVLGGAANNAVALVATVAPDLTKQIQAGKIIQAIAPIVGGKGGGRPDNARGGGKDVGKLDEALAKAKSLLG